MKSTEEELNDTIEQLAAEGDIAELEEVLHNLSAVETARMLSEIPREARTNIISLIEPREAARIVESISEAQAADVFVDLEPSDAAAVLSECESDERVDILGQLPEEHIDKILQEMDISTAEDVRLRIEYDSQTAGGLMVTERLQYPVSGTIGDVIDYLREQESILSDYTVQYVFVSSKSGELCGVLRLRDLVLRRPETAIEEIMIKDPITVSVETSLDELHDIFDSHRFVGIPVVDSNNRMRGIVRRSDVLEAEGDKSDSDYLKSAGILGGEELRTMPLLLRSKRRLSWLTINIFLNIFAASIIALYQDTLQAVIALAVFLPIISDMSGCSGSQAVAVSVRELTLGLVRGRDILRVWRKEVFVGLINGTILGCLIGLVAWFWQGNPFLGLVVGVALAVNTVVAVSIGGVVPLLLTKLGKDPALASGPILTTVTDMFGFFAVLSLAQLALPWLI